MPHSRLKMLRLVLCAGLCILVVDTALPAERPVIYPEPVDSNRVHQIPETLLIQMKDIQNLSQLLDFLGAPAKPELGGPRPIDGSAAPPPTVVDHNVTVDRKKLSGGMDIARSAGCEVELQTVELERPPDPTHVYWPMCVRLARCGGCCTSSLLECVPIKKSRTETKVLHAQYLGEDLGGQFEVVGFKSLKVDKHEKCTCQCREKPEDCTELQSYRAEECKCMCSNLEAREACSGAQWIWDPKECACKCKEELQCSTGFFYNGQSCRCEVLKASLVGRQLPRDDPIPTTTETVSEAPTTPSATTQSTSITNKLTYRVRSRLGLPLTTAATTTTSKWRPPALVRSQVGLPLRVSGEERVRYKAQHVGIRPSDDEGVDVPYTLAKTKAQERKINISNSTSEN